MIREINWEKEYAGIRFYEVQKMIISDDKEKTGVFLGTGVGKTLTCLALGNGRILVICPKQQKLDRTWQRNSEKFNLGKDLTVVSYEEFRRDWQMIEKFDTVIADEAHRLLGVLPDTRQRNKIQIPKTSQIFEAFFNYVEKHNPARLYLATATPVSKPMNLWALAKIFGKNWDFFKFRSTFYFPTMMGRRQVWMPRKDEKTQARMALNVLKFGYTGALRDFVDVPDQTHKEVTIELTGPQKAALKSLALEEADPLVRRSRMRTIENGILYGQKLESISAKEDRMVKDVTTFPSNKTEYIKERAVEFPKLLVFAAYTAQIEEIAKALRKEGHTVFTVSGQTKDRATVFQDAERADRCVIVAQSAICEGYRVPSVPCTIFASKSNRFVHYEQGLGRTIDIEHLEKKLYLHLVVKDGADEACHDAIMNGADFQEKLSVL